LDCLLQNMTSSREDRAYAHVLAVAIMVPTINAFLMLIAVAAKALSFQSTVPFIMIQAINFVLLAPVSSQLLVPFQCTDSDVSRLVIDSNIQCDEDINVKWQRISIGLYMTYCIGFPLLIFMVLYKNRMRLQNEDTLKHYSFFLCGYTSECYYYETIYMLRKVIFPLGAVAPGLTLSGRCVCVLGFSLISFGMHYRFQPFDTRNNNILSKLETATHAFLITHLLSDIVRYISDPVLEQASIDRKARDLCVIVVWLCTWCNMIYLFTKALYGEFIWMFLWNWFPALHRFMTPNAGLKVEDGGTTVRWSSWSGREKREFRNSINHIQNVLGESTDTYSLEYVGMLLHVCYLRALGSNEAPKSGMSHKIKTALKLIPPPLEEGYVTVVNFHLEVLLLGARLQSGILGLVQSGKLSMKDDGKTYPELCDLDEQMKLDVLRGVTLQQPGKTSGASPAVIHPSPQPVIPDNLDKALRKSWCN